VDRIADVARQPKVTGLVGDYQFDTDLDGADKIGKTSSKFVVLARPGAMLDLTADSRWRPLQERTEVGL
jgi:hypothetical protein